MTRLRTSGHYITSCFIDWEAVERDSYVRGIPSIASMGQLDFFGNVTFFVGENGSGKSTLLEAIAVGWGMNPEGGSSNYAFSTHDSHATLFEAMHIIRGLLKPRHAFFLRAESFYNVASKMEEYAQNGLGGPEAFYRQYGGRSLHDQSHGESFLAVIQNTFRDNGLYFLDEPEAALSPSRQLTLLYEIDRLARHGAQFIVATHSPILLGLPGAQILSFDGGHIEEVAYEDTESYQVTEMFINNRARVLQELLASEGDEGWCEG